jgi:hypothetical protein
LGRVDQFVGVQSLDWPIQAIGLYDLTHRGRRAQAWRPGTNLVSATHCAGTPHMTGPSIQLWLSGYCKDPRLLVIGLLVRD